MSWKIYGAKQFFLVIDGTAYTREDFEAMATPMLYAYLRICVAKINDIKTQPEGDSMQMKKRAGAIAVWTAGRAMIKQILASRGRDEWHIAKAFQQIASDQLDVTDYDEMLAEAKAIVAAN